jgi:hypothetical protein
MALTNINDNFQLDAPKHLDNRTGNYASVAAANAAIPEPFRVQGLEVVVITAGQAVKYYYRDGVADEDLIIMPTGGGGGSVAFADITGQPSDNANLDAVLDLKGDMFKSVYDTDADGVVDKAERIEIIVRNSTGSTLAKGKVVYLSGSTGNRPNALLADASLEATATKTIGIVSADIPDNTDGFVAVNGTLHNLNLSSFTAGDMLWLSETAGDYVANTPPAEPSHAVFIGYVVRAHPTEGRMVIAIQNGYELGELHGVEITSPATNDFLYYASDGLWKNTALPKADIGGLFYKMSIAPASVSAAAGTEQTLTTITIPANTLQVGDRVEVYFSFATPANAGTKSFRVRLNNASTGTALNYTTTLGASILGWNTLLMNRVTAANTLIGSTFYFGAATSTSGQAQVNATIDITTPTIFYFNAIRNGAADTITLLDCYIKILR